jgi:hypothetical protein
MKKRLKFLTPYFKAFAAKRALQNAGGIFLAMILSHYFSKTASFWMTGMAAILLQAELGAPLHQGLQRFFWAIILFFVGGQTGVLFHASAGLPYIVVGISTVSAYCYAFYSRRYLGLHFSLLVLIVSLLTLLLPPSFMSVDYLYDLLLGAALGLLSTLLIFPDKADVEFPKRVLPLLKESSDYLGALLDLMLRVPGSEVSALHKREAIERIWANRAAFLPVWVFETGFNPALKPGQYFFVVHLGQLTEILFALHHLARHEFPVDLLDSFSKTLRDSTGRSQELLANLCTLLAGKKLSFSETDFIADLPMLDESFQAQIKLSLELLDISRDYVYLAAFMRYLKDLRLQLLQLAETLS